MNRLVVISWILAWSFAGANDSLPCKFTKSFKEAAKRQHVVVDTQNLYTIFADTLPKDTIALCVVYQDVRVVFLSRVIWSQVDDIYKEYAIWHEMGHCVLHREHTEKFVDNEHPGSMMYPDDRLVKYYQLYYKIHKNYYEHELFHP